MKAIKRILLIGLQISVLSSGIRFPPGLAYAKSPETVQKGRPRQREAQDYYKRWLKEDVVYIITTEEKAAFKKLTTNEEKEKFIEQFWRRRDPNPRTPSNEMKEEHYRRIAHANQHFSSAWPGWMTDRGKVYIIHGPPDEREEFPSGGTYERPFHEGGGTTATYPFEIWRYRSIEGLESNIEIEFVDRDFSGVYRLALSPEEKDAFLFVPNAGFTLAEQLGLAERKQRPYFAPGASYPLMNYRARDTPFARYETFVNIQRPRQLRYRDLREAIDLRISYSKLSFKRRTDFFRLSNERLLVPINLEVLHKDLTFKKNTAGFYEAKVAVYGMVTSITKEIVNEFEDELVASYASPADERGLLGGSLYQRLVLLDKHKRYKLVLVVKDLNSGDIGTIQEVIHPPAFDNEKISASSLIISDFIRPARVSSSNDQMFVLGDVEVRPSLTKSFVPTDYFAVYLQLYNLAVDPITKNPSFRVRYRITTDRETKVEVSDEVGESVQYFSPQRLVLIKKLPLKGLEPGRYRVEIQFTDRIKNEVFIADDEFTITHR